MEPTTGLELLKSIRSDELTKSFFFIMITAKSKIENIMAAMMPGFLIILSSLLTLLRLKIS